MSKYARRARARALLPVMRFYNKRYTHRLLLMSATTALAVISALLVRLYKLKQRRARYLSSGFRWHTQYEGSSSSAARSCKEFINEENNFGSSTLIVKPVWWILDLPTLCFAFSIFTRKIFYATWTVRARWKDSIYHCSARVRDGTYSAPLVSYLDCWLGKYVSVVCNLYDSRPNRILFHFICWKIAPTGHDRLSREK